MQKNNKWNITRFNMYCQIISKKNYELILEQIAKPFPNKDEHDQYYYYYAYLDFTKKAMKKIKLMEFRGHYEVVRYLSLSGRIFLKFKIKALENRSFLKDCKEQLYMTHGEVDGRVLWYFLVRIHEPLKYVCGVCKTDLIYNAVRIFDGITKNSNLELDQKY